MKENHPNQLRELSVEGLRRKMQEMSDELFNLRFRNTVRQLDNPLKIREVRHDLARIRTILHEHDKGIRKVSGQE